MSSSDGTGERDRHAHRVGAGSTMLEANSTRLPLLLDIFEPSSSTMPWLSRLVNGSVKLDEAHVEQHLGDEARVQQVQDGVLDAADVRVDGSPLVRPRGVEKASVGVVRGEEAQEVPRAVDEGVHRVGVAQGGLAGLGIDRRHPVGRRAPSGDVPFGREVEPFARRAASAAAGRRAPGTMRPSSVWIIGIGVPQKRWREISQSRRR